LIFRGALNAIAIDDNFSPYRYSLALSGIGLILITMTRTMRHSWGRLHALRFRLTTAAVFSLAISLFDVQASTAAPRTAMQFKGICNASSGVALTDDLFVVADDEDKVLNKRLELKPLPFRLYSLRRPGAPVSVGELPGNATDPEIVENVSGELDLEASASLDDVVFWIGSHSASSGGKAAPNRRRLFAVRFNLQGEKLSVTQVGGAYKTLLEDLSKDSRYDQFMLQEAAQQDSKKPGGLSIEGMTVLPNGALAIGFRNPVPGGQALVATLLNPMQVIASQKARFGQPILLNLGGQGIRGMDTVQNAVLIVSGPATVPEINSQGTGSVPPHRIYRWSGIGSAKPLPMVKPDLSALFVEGVFPVGKQLLLVSDDGKAALPGGQCQDLTKEQQRFRAEAVPLPLP
jgi:hypothetical protein